MNEQVAQLIERLKEQSQEDAKKAKREHLYSIGFVEKTYVEGEHSKEILEKRANGKYRYDAKENRYYIATPIEVTDEEYAEICRYAPPKPKQEKRNEERGEVGIGTLGVIGVIILILGIISAIAMVSEDMVIAALATFASCGITCAFMVTLGKMLEVQKAIKRKIDTM